MNNAQLDTFRNAADQMLGSRNWQWVADHETQLGPCIVMDGITEKRATRLVETYGGTIKKIGGDK